MTQLLSVANRSAVRGTWVAALSAAALLFGTGCATTIEAAFDRDADFSRLRTWDFSRTAERSDDALPGLIRSGLGSKGYVPASGAPDFLVAYRLDRQTRVEQVRVPQASYLLSSHDSTPSYVIGGTATEDRRFEYVTLSIEVLDGEGAVIWKAVLRSRLEPGDRFDLDDAVRDLLERFPDAPPAPTPAEGPPQLATLRPSPAGPPLEVS